VTPEDVAGQVSALTDWPLVRYEDAPCLRRIPYHRRKPSSAQKERSTAHVYRNRVGYSAAVLLHRVVLFLQAHATSTCRRFWMPPFYRHMLRAHAVDSGCLFWWVIMTQCS